MQAARVADFQDPNPLRRKDRRDQTLSFRISRQKKSAFLRGKGGREAERKRQGQSQKTEECRDGAEADLLCGVRRGMRPEIVSFHDFEEF